MSDSTTLPRRFYALPVIGWIARDVIEGDPDNKWYAATIVVTLWLLSFLQWGLAALVVPALLLVPLCLLTLVALTRG